MACCYIAAFCVGQLVKTCQFLDLDESIQYNDDLDPSRLTKDTYHISVSETSEQDPSSAVLSIDGLTCSACVRTVTQALEALDDVEEARISLQTHEAVVIGTRSPLDRTKLIEAIREAGYDGKEGPRSHDDLTELLQMKAEIALLRTSFLGLLRYGAVIQILSYVACIDQSSSSKAAAAIAGILHVASVAVAVICQYQHALWIHRDSMRLIRNRSMNMNSLVSISTVLGLAFSILDIFVRGPSKSTSYGMTTSGIALIVIAGRYLDALSQRQASKHLTKLYNALAAPDYVKLHPSRKIVPSSFLRRGDTIYLEPFSVVPCDSYVIQGVSCVNQSMVTGESLPVSKSSGDFLLAGTRNLNGALCCVVHRERQESFYAQLVNSVKDATATKFKGEDAIGLATQYFSMGIVVLAFLSPLFQIFYEFRSTGFYSWLTIFTQRAMTILVSACPCALGLAVPSAVIAAVDAAHTKGVLLTKGASTIQELDLATHVVFDKTGTLTEGTLQVADIALHSSWQSHRTTFWILACALEEQEAKGHPAGLAIFKKGIEELGTQWLDYNSQKKLSETLSVPGQGVAGKVRDQLGSQHYVSIGSWEFLKQNGILNLIEAAELQQSSGIVVYVGIDGICAGRIHLQDHMRPRAKDTIKSLKRKGYQCSMLTGDMDIEARRVSLDLDISILGARADPDTKLRRIRSLQSGGLKVAMVGDGLNDAPSLAAADVGIIMPRDSSIATVGGTVMILNSDIGCIPLVFNIAKETMHQIRFNIIWATLYNMIALSLATGVVRPFGFVLTPSLGAVCMSASSIIITIQSLRLRARLCNKS